MKDLQDLLDQGKVIVTGGGYTFMSDGRGNYCYFAYGTFPGCLRGSDKPDLKVYNTEFKEVTLKEVVCKKWYFPEFYTLSNFIMSYMYYSGDYSVDFDGLNNFCVNSPYSSDELKDSMKSSKIFKEYFKSKQDC